MTSAAVIVATVGKQSLARTIRSILGQTYKDVTCVVAVDGSRFTAAADAVLDAFRDDARVQIYYLPQNTGANGFVCHRIYGALPLLVNQDYIFYLDDDNWYDSEHVGQCVSACQANHLDWCFALRKIFLEDETFLCNDECESIGYWPTWYNSQVHHIDTNCYCLRRETAVQLASMWHKSRIANGEVKKSADTGICEHLINSGLRSALVPIASVNYTLGSWALSPSPDFFLKGNDVFRHNSGGTLPWQRAEAAGAGPHLRK